jgi:hypothetical protein
MDWALLFRGYKAAVDLPANVFYSELMAYYPGAKVILTMREAERLAENTFSRMTYPKEMPSQSLTNTTIGLNGSFLPKNC